MKQIGLAGQTHLNLHKYFPSGGWGYHWWGDPDRGYGANQPGGWAYSILPFLEEKAIHDFGKGLPTAQKYLEIGHQAQEYAPSYICPSRRGRTVTEVQDDIYNGPPGARYTFKVSRSDYAGNAGTDFWTFGGPGSGSDTASFSGKAWFATAGNCSNCPAATGITYAGSEVRLKDIPDGASKTYFVGEKFLQPQHYSGNPGGKGDNNSLYQGHDYDVNRWAGDGNTYPTANDQTWVPYKDDNYADADFGITVFGSAHQQGAFFVMCDGSVQTISYNIDPRTHYSLSNRRDGHTVQVSN